MLARSSRQPTISIFATAAIETLSVDHAAALAHRPSRFQIKFSLMCMINWKKIIRQIAHPTISHFIFIPNKYGCQGSTLYIRFGWWCVYSFNSSSINVLLIYMSCSFRLNPQKTREYSSQCRTIGSWDITYLDSILKLTQHTLSSLTLWRIVLTFNKVETKRNRSLLAQHCYTSIIWS